MFCAGGGGPWLPCACCIPIPALGGPLPAPGGGWFDIVVFCAFRLPHATSLQSASKAVLIPMEIDKERLAIQMMPM